MRTAIAIESFLSWCRYRRLSANTLRWYRGILRQFNAIYPKLPTKLDDCMVFLLSCQGGDERCHGYYRTLHAFYNYAEKYLKVKKNPMHQLEAPLMKRKLPRPLTMDQLAQLLAYPHTSRVKASLLFLADTGARVGELTKLKEEDFLETPWGYIAMVAGKSGARYIPVSDDVYRALITVLPLGVSVNRMYRILSKAFRDAHVPGTAHSLRHTFGTYWEGDEQVLQQIMGHSRFTTTMKYRLLRTRILSEMHRLRSPLRLVLPFH